ncbi:MAG: phosphodiesterase [Clostridiales bacterium]|nr:phosphodiesterase [Clostridiales bacterium]
MKLMFASDIHGSAYYMQKVLDAFVNEQADKLILLGDLLYHGPRNPLPREYDPQKVAKMLNENKQNIIAVRGNCDSEVDQMVLEFPIMQDSLMLFLDKRQVFITHGHLFSLEKPPLLNKGDVLINGHFHIGEIKETDEFIYLNPGSVSLPKNDFRGYIIYRDGTFSLKSFENEIKDMIKIAE